MPLRQSSSRYNGANSPKTDPRTAMPWYRLSATGPGQSNANALTAKPARSEDLNYAASLLVAASDRSGSMPVSYSLSRRGGFGRAGGIGLLLRVSSRSTLGRGRTGLLAPVTVFLSVSPLIPLTFLSSLTTLSTPRGS
jgi:hypothetical protein